MSSGQEERSHLDARARQGETVVPGGTGGKSLEAQEHLAQGPKQTLTLTCTSHRTSPGRSILPYLKGFLGLGLTITPGRSRGGQTRKEQLGTEGYQQLGQKGGQTRKEQIGREGYQEMGRKGGLGTTDKSGGERAAQEGADIDESKFSKS
ncbi:hypothetical protein RND71_038540 [Anisodus tanguticus]|uniref:Uncharacterized protein n=1 Tax=Anisodus tanguticus TaxID=243964 RepID=A0AAE1R0V5_9SOLA|nr:hypothetical protein RND71_038540 [Anisodus tanguticus]